MDPKPNLDDYDEMTQDFYIEIRDYRNGEPYYELVEAYRDELTEAWENFGREASKYE